MHPFVELAGQTISEYIRNKKVVAPPAELTAEMKQKAGVFVCLKKKGELRGCIGTFMPTTDNVFQEIVRNSIASAKDDPRFPPVQASELEEIEITVDVLSVPEKVDNISELDAKKYGVIVAKGHQRGLLLPDLDGVPTVEEQLRIAKMKAGINPADSNVELFKFTVDRYQ